MQKKKGISLIVLVITIIVMIILAASVVITLSNTGIIDRADQAVKLTNEKQVQDLAAMIWSEKYMDKYRGEDLTREVLEELEVEGERLLFTTFEEAKLIEDLNDLNRMIGKVNEHVKDLSAIQARLYNELVGEEEIIVEPVVEEPHVVIPEAPVEKPTNI